MPGYLCTNQHPPWLTHGMQGSGRATNLDDHVLECAWQQQARAQQVGPHPGWLSRFHQCCLFIRAALKQLQSSQAQLLNAALQRTGCIIVADGGCQPAECGCGKSCDSDSLCPTSPQSPGSLDALHLKGWLHHGEQAQGSISISIWKSVSMCFALVTCTGHLQRCSDNPDCLD